MDLLRSHFNLREMPFRLTPDERYFFESGEHGRAMAHLLFGLSQGDGFVVITGEVGAGKTTLMERLLARLNPSAYRPAVITTPAVSGWSLLRLIGAEFGITRVADQAEFLGQICERWRGDHARGRRPVIVIDEAQALPAQTLEILRLLSNLADRSKPLMQVILLGQPEFRRTLASPHMEQLRQRVLASYHLNPLPAADVAAYIRHRLAAAGCEREDLFDEGAFAAIYAATNGVPRRINRLCARLLFNAALEGEQHIGAATAKRIADELERDLTAGSPPEPPPRARSRTGLVEPADFNPDDTPTSAEYFR